MNNYDVFVYCGGKCGSSTLENTFKQNKFRCFRTHGLGDYKKNYGHTNIGIFELIDNSCENVDTVYIIDCYRTPIERKISSFFHNINSHLPNYENLKTEEIMEYFNKNHINTLEEYHSINDVLKNYDIPVLNDFNFDKRYTIIRKDNKVIIKLLFKDIKIWGKLLSEIFEREIAIHNQNLTETKKIYKLYQEFKNKYRVPKEYILNLSTKDSQFKIYNTKEEQEDYINHWLTKSF
jgi:hypothetical protein